MKRALALLEQTKHTMPHLPRPTSTEKQDSQPSSITDQASLQYSKGQKRMPSASGRQSMNEGNQNNNATEMSSRKSTAVSSSTRIGSSGNNNTARNKNRSTFLGNNQTDTADKQPLYELSLKSTANKKPPHKLKPLNSSKTTGNTAISILEIENAYQKEIMREIDDDLTDYLDTNQIFTQMNNAFGGASTTTEPKKESKNKSKLAKTLGQLDPILEEATGQVVPYQPNMTLQEQRAKKNEILKNKVKKLTGVGSTVPAITEGPQYDAETFITGTKIAQQPGEDDHIIREYESQKADRKKKKHYKYEEDELLDDLDQHEKDMNDMLKYLTEVEELIKGQDLKSIQQMMDVTKETMNQHFSAYDKFKGQIEEIDIQAEEAIRVLNFYDTDGDRKNSKYDKRNYQLEKVFEARDEEDKESETLKKKQGSHEQSKNQIVNQLVNMNHSMREFTSDLESRLDKAYKSGATKKFGYDGITNASQQPIIDDNKREERALNKIHSQAQQYIEQNSASALLKMTPSMSNAGKSLARKNSGSSSNAVRALPSSDNLKRKGSVKNSRATKKLNDDINI